MMVKVCLTWWAEVIINKEVLAKHILFNVDRRMDSIGKWIPQANTRKAFTNFLRSGGLLKGEEMLKYIIFFL